MNSAPPVAESKKRKRTRRNYQKELMELQAYCEIHVEILNEEASRKEPGTPGVLSDYSQGKLTAFRQVLARIGAPTG